MDSSEAFGQMNLVSQDKDHSSITKSSQPM